MGLGQKVYSSLVNGYRIVGGQDPNIAHYLLLMRLSQSQFLVT